MSDPCFRDLPIGQQRTLLVQAKMKCELCHSQRNLDIHCRGILNQFDLHDKKKCDPAVLCYNCHCNACPIARNMAK